MGWGSGCGKAEVINPAAGDCVACGVSEHHPFHGKTVLIDISGLAHKAAKRDARTVVRDGTSLQQQEYVRKRIASVAAEGGRPVLVLDGRAYPPKLATRDDRRSKAAAAQQRAELLDSAMSADAASAWKAAAGPQEAFWMWLIDHCRRHRIEYLVSPYEADAQLIGLSHALGDTAIVWAAANDSDLVAFGGYDIVYDWDMVARTYRRVRLLEDILGQVVGTRSFVGWTYDRFLIFTILSGNDYFKNLPGHALTTVYKVMASAKLDTSLIAPAVHPSLDSRPACWFAREALLAYAEPVFSAVARKEGGWTASRKRDVSDRLLAAYHAIRQHPISHLLSFGPDALHPSVLSVGVMGPLSSREMPSGSTLPELIPGVALEADASEATAWARGELRINEGGVLVSRALPPIVDPADDTASVNEDDGKSVAGGDAPPCALDGSTVTLDTVDTTATAAELRAFLGAAGIDFYASATKATLRHLSRRLLEQGIPPAIQPAHPSLHMHSRSNRYLTLTGGEIIRGAALHTLVHELAQGGLVFDEPIRNRFLPFHNTQNRGLRLYDSEASTREGYVRLGSRSHAHSHQITAQCAIYAPTGEPPVEAFVFRMAVHASMRQIDHVAMLAVTRKQILLAPNSICSCEVGVECSHLYCILICLYLMQQVPSYAVYLETVLVYDKSRAASGGVVWWPDVYQYGLGSRPSDASALSFDVKVVNASAPSDPPIAAQTVTRHISHHPNYHHSSHHVAELRALCASFRQGQISALFREEYGDLVAPPSPDAAIYDEQEPSDDDSDDLGGAPATDAVGPEAATAAAEGEVSEAGSCSDDVADDATSPLRPGPQQKGYGSPTPQPPSAALPPLRSPRSRLTPASPYVPASRLSDDPLERSQGRGKRQRGRKTPASRQLRF